MADKVAVILAAGKGTRMKSELPKVLHAIAGRTLVTWAVHAALDAGAERCIVVIGHGREALREELAPFGEEGENRERN